MSGAKILWGQIIVVGLVALSGVWVATQWTAWQLGFQSRLGPAWFMLGDWPIYPPPAFFVWWFIYEAYAPDVFVRGAFMAAGGAFAQPMSESDMLAEVWGQESAIRQETADWLFPFLTLAYQPLTDADLDSYIAFSVSAAGKKANAAIFAAFDAMFVHVSQELGQSAARLMAGQAI